MLYICSILQSYFSVGNMVGVLYGKLKHEGLGREADTARGAAECCIMPRDPNPECFNFHTARTTVL